MVSITIYDGGSGIGGNKIYLEENNQGVFLDFGLLLHRAALRGTAVVIIKPTRPRRPKSQEEAGGWPVQALQRTASALRGHSLSVDHSIYGAVAYILQGETTVA
jgi:mRNA degradation ribonuclease J1/J2